MYEPPVLIGVMGKATADLLVHAGYSVSAWTRTERTHGAVRCGYSNTLI